MSAKIGCPHCGASAVSCTPDVVYANVENYGSNSFVVKCCKCGKPIFIQARRRVEIETVCETSSTDFSFSNDQMKD